jgi:hypothetical protein
MAPKPTTKAWDTCCSAYPVAARAASCLTTHGPWLASVLQPIQLRVDCAIAHTTGWNGQIHPGPYSDEGIGG